MTSAFLRLSVLAGIAVAHAGLPAHAAGSYDTCTGFVDSVPATIGSQGTWCLRRDLSTAMTSGAAITIAANNVTLDCNGFKLGGLAGGNASETRGILAQGRQNVAVRNCAIRGFLVGIGLSWAWVANEQVGGGYLVEDNLVEHALTNGIYVTGPNSLVRRNRVFDTGGAEQYGFAYGISAGDADVLDNIVQGVQDLGWVYGIHAEGAGIDVSGNRVRDVIGGIGPDHRSWGIQVAAEDATIADNRVRSLAGLQGAGIQADAANTFCMDNTVVGFASALVGCERVRGNLSQ